MPDCSILRIGRTDSESGNSAGLRNAIVSHFHDGAPTVEASSSLSSIETNSKKSLTISNRYFDASVLLLGLGESNNNSHGDGETTEDGILLIFNASLSTSFDTLSQLHSTATQTDQAGELLRLCIGAYTSGPSPLSDGSKKSEEEYSRRVLWCLDHGYEYVEVDLTVEGMARGHDERDKDGFARVVEAVGSCMWSSHVMKKREGGGGRGVGLMASLTKDVSSTKDSSGESQSQSNATEKWKEKTGKTTTSSPPSNDVEREKAAMASLMQDMNNAQPSVAEFNDNSPKEEENTQQPSHQEEMSIHQIESVISEAKSIREASKNSSMSDEERRERAGDTAMRLMGLLDSLGFDEDTDNEESSSDDDEGLGAVVVDDQQ